MRNMNLPGNAAVRAVLDEPNSQWWADETFKVANQLADREGIDWYRAWADEKWPGDALDLASWRDMYYAIKAELEHPAVCGCNGVNRSSCPVCRVAQKIGVLEGA